MRINDWLENFKDHWEKHNIKGIISLFAKNVVYYETPFLRLNNLDEVAKEWEVIKHQNNISLNFKGFSSNGNKHSVIWNLRYFDINKKEQNFAGTYLIELNDEGLCTYFHHSCEKENE
ncbi:MAG: nuclear transport factor 2 family protein [Candidatus Aenigmatarchaeota archaeon]